MAKLSHHETWLLAPRKLSYRNSKDAFRQISPPFSFFQRVKYPLFVRWFVRFFHTTF